ncbi:unnamed protein product, partial [Durusdinium trenchii]
WILAKKLAGWLHFEVEEECDRCGNSKQLRKSQVYPLGYGRAIRRLHMQWMVPW